MADRARALTDKKLASISARLKREYKAAQRELEEKLSKYMANAEKRVERLSESLLSAVRAGDKDAIAKAEAALRKAKINATLNDKRYREMIDDITDRLADVNQTALSYVCGQMPDIYRRNYNGASEPAAEVGMSFSLMNEEAVARRVREGDIKLPKKKIDIPKDKRWNTKQLNSAVLQGIIQGESMQKIAKRILPIVDNNRDAAIRNARTMVTGAENEGRLDGFHKLEEEGAILKKVWIATADSRTREAHLFLDGQEVGIDEPFVDADGNELMYPGDPSAEPGTVYNCRCSMRTHIVGFRKSDGRVEPVKFDHKSGMHQDAIEREKEKRGEIPQKPEPPKPVVIPVESQKIKATLPEEKYNEFMGLVNGSENIEVYRKYAEDISSIQRESTGGYYTPAADTVHYSLDNAKGHSEYSTLGHELSHAFDKKMANLDGLNFKEVELINEKVKQTGNWYYSNRQLFAPMPSNSDEFLTALREDAKAMRAKGLPNLYAEFRATAESRNSTAGVQDALDGFFGTQKQLGGWGHGDAYYNRVYNRRVSSFGVDKAVKEAYKELGFDAPNQTKVKQLTRHYEAASEAWANVGSAVTCKGDEYEAVKKYMPKTLEAYLKIVGGVKK